MTDVEYDYDPDGVFAAFFGDPPEYDVKTQWCKYCDEVFTLRCATEPAEPDSEGLRLTVLDPEPLYAHLRAKHPGVVPLGDLPPYEDAPPEENFWDDRTTPDANGRP